MPLSIRKARLEDKPKVVEVESLSTPTLSYLPYVYEDWVSDTAGSFSVVELDGELIGVGKYTKMPDGSAWLEALRVTPARQGLGGGKILYEHWLSTARSQGVHTLRMYTNTSNVVSKGLAERYGLRVQGTYREARLSCKEWKGSAPEFSPVRDADEAAGLLMPLQDAWGGFMVMNRTFYRYSRDLCSYRARRGEVYRDPEGRVVVLGARFMPWQALHVGAYSGDAEPCVRFALSEGARRGAEYINVLYPVGAYGIEKELNGLGFVPTKGDFITMGIDI